MIDAVAFCPQAPALVPQVGRGLDTELADVRRACADAVGQLQATAGPLAVLASGPATRRHDPDARGTFAGFGVDLEVGFGTADGPVELPAALSVGAWLTGGAGTAYSVAGALPELPADTSALLVMGDASARRTEKAPGYLDERAAGYDEAVRAAFASGDPAQLAALDPGLGAELLASGARLWHAVAALLTRSYQADVLYAGDPFGVEYLVAVWQ